MTQEHEWHSPKRLKLLYYSRIALAAFWILILAWGVSQQITALIVVAVVMALVQIFFMAATVRQKRLNRLKQGK